MARYIDADKIVFWIRHVSSNGMLCDTDVRKVAFSDEIARMPTADVAPRAEWISVEERLPDDGQVVLAYRSDFRGDMMNTYTYLGSGNWEHDYAYRGSSEREGITHWMPLPEPPKGEKHDPT